MNKKEAYKKLLAMLTAGTLATTPVMAGAEGEKDNKERKRFSLAEQTQETKQITTVEEFEDGVYAAYDEVSKYITYGDTDEEAEKLFHDVKKVYYLVNHSYITPELDATLIANGYIQELDFSNKEKRATFYEALSLTNVIADFNQSRVRHTDNIADVLDVSVFCSDEGSKKHVHEVFEKWFNAHKNNEYNFDEFVEAYKMITTLNAEEQRRNADALSVEEEWFTKVTVGGDLMQFLRDWFRDFHENDPELNKFFNIELLNKGQYYLRDDQVNEYDYNKEIDRNVYYYGVLWKYCLDDVNIEIVNKFRKSMDTRELYYYASAYGENDSTKRL